MRLSRWRTVVLGRVRAREELEETRLAAEARQPPQALPAIIAFGVDRMVGVVLQVVDQTAVGLGQVASRLEGIGEDRAQERQIP